MSTISKDIRQRDDEKIESIDYKMVTFSLAGKDYSIDIMKVKEISRAKRFTFVPNAEAYVRGVYNLRGDIISLIDLRVLFNLPVAEREENDAEDMIILRLDDYLMGVLVDKIDRVVGINSKAIQPPHPIFGDINIKFIKGVVENEDRLYIILDVEKILGDHSDEIAEVPQTGAARGPERELPPSTEVEQKGEEEDFSFITETLRTFSGFYVSRLNSSWVKRRLKEWKQECSRGGRDVQLQKEEDAALFLRPFYSPYTGFFWGDEYRDEVKQILAQMEVQGNLMVWNPGCGSGYESYSLALCLREMYPDSQLKIWAHDSDLMSISTASNLVFQESDIPDSFLDYTVEGANGLQFHKEIRDSLLFEFHNVLHSNPFPDVDLILARDILSFQNEQEQKAMVLEFLEKLKPGALLIPGRNEELNSEEFMEISEGSVRAYKKVER